MSDLTLVVGSKAYSSWSLRPWLAMKQAGLAFAETVIPLRQPDTAARIAGHSPSGRVPTLIHDGLTVWDSLAICEYVAELAPEAGLWPADRAARAVARSVSAEMHSGFASLRSTMPMNLKRDRKGEGKGNAFLSNIRECDAIAEVVRCFEDENVLHVENRVDPLSDIETIETELILKDLETVEKRLDRARRAFDAPTRHLFGVRREILARERAHPELRGAARVVDVEELEHAVRRDEPSREACSAVGRLGAVHRHEDAEHRR